LFSVIVFALRGKLSEIIKQIGSVFDEFWGISR